MSPLSLPSNLEARRSRSSGDPAAAENDGSVFALNRELLRRAVENVLRNAIRYTPEESVIDVQLKTGEDRARISVRDYGPGVPDEALEKIFQPFFRVDDSRTSSTGGVGLGLTIAHHAIGAHRGEIRAENAHPGLRVWLEIRAER